MLTKLEINKLVRRAQQPTVWAVDFETPAGSITFYSFFSWAASAEINKNIFASWCFEVCGPHNLTTRLAC
jgi:hypothetical protein